MKGFMSKRINRYILSATFIFVLASVGVSFQSPVTLTLGAHAKPNEGSQTKDVLQKVCGNCHALDRVTASRRSLAQWEEVTDKMITLGAKGTEDEFTAVLGYLVSHYGRVNVNTATSGEIAEVLGLSPQEAEAIVKYRRDKGKFEDFEALSKTPGVAVEKLEKSRDAISF